jgi:hypothetical protein
MSAVQQGLVSFTALPRRTGELDEFLEERIIAGLDQFHA